MTAPVPYAVRYARELLDTYAYLAGVAAAREEQARRPDATECNRINAANARAEAEAMLRRYQAAQGGQ